MNLLQAANNKANGLRILWDWLHEGQEVVAPDHAQRRTNTCLQCHFNEDGGVVSKAIAYAIRQQTEFKNDLELKVQGEANLKSCSVCTCWLPLKVWIPMDNLRKEETPESLAKYPAWCWIKTEPHEHS